MTWPSVNLEECCRIVGGATPSTSSPGFWDGDIWWATPKDLSDADSMYLGATARSITASGLASCAAEVLPPGSVLFSSRAPIGLVAINRVPVATNQGFKSFVPDRTRLEPGYLYWWLKAHRSRLESLGNGATFKELSKAAVARIALPLPPITVQRRIVAILDRTDEIRQKRRQTLVHLSALLEAIFAEVCGPTTPILTIGSALDQRILLVHKDGNHGSLYPRAEDFGDEGIPFVSAKSISESGYVEDRLTERLSETKAASLKHGWILPGDVLLAHNATVGRVGLYRGGYDRAIVGTSLTVFRPNPKRILPEFLFAALRARGFQQQLEKNMGQATRNQVPITAQRLLELPIPNIETQRLFALRATEVDAVRESASAHLAKLDALFASLQHRAFVGELTAKDAERELVLAG